MAVTWLSIIMPISHKSRPDPNLLIQIADSDTHWMEPRDVLLSELSLKVNDRSKTSLSSYLGGACVLQADGSVLVRDESTTTKQVVEGVAHALAARQLAVLSEDEPRKPCGPAGPIAAPLSWRSSRSACGTQARPHSSRRALPASRWTSDPRW